MPKSWSRDEALRDISDLREGPWERRASQVQIDRWLENFTGEVLSPEEEQNHALHLLTQFTYFGEEELRVLLKSMYRDLLSYPIIESIRRSNGDTLDNGMISHELQRAVASCRFVGIGNPSESGTHLLYFFRQENNLHKNLFINTHQIFRLPQHGSSLELSNPTVTRYVFIDDFCGSGTQAKEYSRDLVEAINDTATRMGLSVETAYYVLAATEGGLAEVVREAKYADVGAVLLLDDSYRAFAATSRAYREAVVGIDQAKAETVMRHYGSKLVPTHPLGYKDGQLTLGFHHNVPDNTLPVFSFSASQSSWYPIMKRFPKYGG